MDADVPALQAMSDDELDTAVKALCKAGLPGRDEYLAEQQRRKEARLASKPAWVKVRAVEAKWRRAQAKTAKAETAVQEATAAVEAARTTLAAAESLVIEANSHLATVRAEEAAVKVEVAKSSIAAGTGSAESAEPTLPAVSALPADYKQQPAVAAKLQQAEQLLKEVLAGAPREADSKCDAAHRDLGGNSGAAAASNADAGAQRRTSSMPAQRDGLWQAAKRRSRSPVRDLRYSGRRPQDS